MRVLLLAFVLLLAVPVAASAEPQPPEKDWCEPKKGEHVIPKEDQLADPASAFFVKTQVMADRKAAQLADKSINPNTTVLDPPYCSGFFIFDRKRATIAWLIDVKQGDFEVQWLRRCFLLPKKGSRVVVGQTPGMRIACRPWRQWVDDTTDQLPPVWSASVTPTAVAARKPKKCKRYNTKQLPPRPPGHPEGSPVPDLNTFLVVTQMSVEKWRDRMIDPKNGYGYYVAPGEGTANDAVYCNPDDLVVVDEHNARILWQVMLFKDGETYNFGIRCRMSGYKPGSIFDPHIGPSVKIRCRPAILLWSSDDYPETT